MRVLVACEESQAVCKAFRELGHEAYSCDTLLCSGGHPEWHIHNDILKVLNQEKQYLEDGSIVYIDKWDLMIAHPPCTYLSNAGANRLYPQKGVLNQDRYNKGLEAKDFFMSLLNANIEKICVENPIPSTIFGLPKYTQTIQPFEHGHAFRKKTCLWLKNLSPITPTNIVKENITGWVSGGSKDSKGNKRKMPTVNFRDPKNRSKTFPGIANAMATQWGKLSSDKSDDTNKTGEFP